MPDTSNAWQLSNKPEYLINQIEDAEQAAEALRKEWELGINPIQSMAELFEEKGLRS